MIEVNGKAGIVVKVLADSISKAGHRFISYEVQVPRIVWCEILTHGMLVRNASSSRAIPFEKMMNQLAGAPVRFGKANKGMQDAGEFEGKVNLREVIGANEDIFVNPDEAWEAAKHSAIEFSKAFYEAGFSKQIFNRLSEPFQMIKAVISGTEWDNFEWLRNHSAADPTLEEFAKCIAQARQESVPFLLNAGEYHLPYVETYRNAIGQMVYRIYSPEENVNIYLDAEQAIKVSCARTAAVSFRAIDYGVEQCNRVYESLFGGDHKHSSAAQHCATPMQEYQYEYIEGQEPHCVNDENDPKTWEPGISHVDRDGQLWSAQLRGWIMHRKTIKGENYIKPKEI